MQALEIFSMSITRSKYWRHLLYIVGTFREISESFYENQWDYKTAFLLKYEFKSQSYDVFQSLLNYDLSLKWNKEKKKAVVKLDC